MRQQPRSIPLIVTALLFLLGSACGPLGESASGRRRVTVVPERWISAWNIVSNQDSPALWRGTEEIRVVTTAKGTHDLWVYDATDGTLLKRVGGQGDGPGQFNYPNGIAILGDLLLVVERDSHRVQMLSLPDFRSMGSFGAEELIRPYGIALFSREGGTLVVYVTDDYGNELYIPGLARPTRDFTRRVKQFQLRVGSDGVPEASFVRAFGQGEGPGALRVVESIQVDEAHGVLLIADELNFELELYNLEGEYLDRTVGAGLYRYGEPEGIALYRCGSDGYWILTDQGEARSVFHVLDRQTFQHLGSFAGRITANTDGIWLDQGEVPGLGKGILLASHRDGGVAAFAWEDVGTALGLRTGCGGPSP
jgi:3-phytase